jgi:Asp-tRNA(Asn)/Glu-tRNA(Gln) amidotransferase A subunit family amidase
MANSLPIGVQLIAGRGRDGLLCHLASQFETAHPWTQLAPLR